MSFFTFDSKEAGSGFDPVPAGEYEVVISEAKVTTFNSGNSGLKITLTIRSDVNQEGGNRKVFENFVASPAAMFKFHNLSKALGWAEGESVASLEDYADRVLYQPVRAKLKVTPASGNYQAKNDVVTYLPAQEAYSGGQGVTDPFASGQGVDISDDDLPF